MIQTDTGTCTGTSILTQANFLKIITQYDILLRHEYGILNKVFVNLRSEINTPLDAIFTVYLLVVNSPTFVAIPSEGCDDHV